MATHPNHTPISRNDFPALDKFMEHVNQGGNEPQEKMMSAWNFDMAAAPKGKSSTSTRIVKGEEREFTVHQVAPLWMATVGGKVHRTYWIPGTSSSKGRWSGFNADSEQPMAWQEFIVPEHPDVSKPLQDAMTATADHLFADGVGGQ